MKRSWPLLLILPLTAAFSLTASETSIGIVNMKGCIEKSKLGIHEKNSFESLKKQISEKLEKTDKELTDMAKKLEDQDYLDSLSPAAEKELKERFQALSQEMARAQNQYFQLLNQANYKLLQTIHDSVAAASENVRLKHNFSAILNSEAAFAIVTSLDVTNEVIQEMDRQMDKAKQETAAK